MRTGKTKTETALDLIVVGGGPTGVAALHFAKQHGLSAVALEAGPHPLADVVRYPNGLVLLSSPKEYQVGQIPFDCKDPRELTREEVLHYYARLIRLGDLRVELQQRCVDLRPAPGVVLVTARHRGKPVIWRARHVLMTSWYQGVPLPKSTHANNPVVVRNLSEPSSAVGRRVVILGGGFSAYEHAHALMAIGQTVTVISRGRLGEFFHDPVFQRLQTATRSVLHEQTRALSIGNGAVTFRDPKAAHRVPCELVVSCYGRRIQPSVLRMLARAGVLPPETIRRLKAALSPDDRLRAGVPAKLALQQSLDAHPDLYDQLVVGYRGIYLAGGALHVGGSHAGVAVSIATAEIAIKAMCGVPLPIALRSPLPRSLPEVLGARPDPVNAEALNELAKLIPLRVCSWSRMWPKVPLGEMENGTKVRLPRKDRYVQQVKPGLRRMLRQVLDAVDGERNVRQVITSLAESPAQHLGVLRVLVFLWQHNGLTWVPSSTRV